jgi:hypothetical protein
VIAVVVAVAAVLVPLAAGAGSDNKTYTLSGDASVCSGTASVTFDVVVKNTARTQNLGSVDLYAPRNVAVTSAAFAPGSGGGSTKLIRPLRTTTSGVSADPNDATGVPRTIVSVRSLQLGFNATVTVRVTANVTGTGTWSWYSLAKQANDFNPGDLDQSNALTMTGSPPSVIVSACSYVFAQGPSDAERGSAQTVKVQLHVGNQPVSVSGPLTLSALQNGAVSSNFSAPTLTSAAPDATGTFAGKQWTFGVIGNVLGDGYALKAGSTISDPTFSIVSGLCPPNTTDTQHLASTCSLTSDLNGGFFESGVTINNHKLDDSIAINFAPASAVADNKCAPWNRPSYTVNGVKYNFPGVELDFGWGSGMLQVVYRVRNADWVLTDASRGNQDLEICAGARHWEDFENGGDGRKNTDGVIDPFTTKSGADAVWDGTLYWGVLASVQNPSKVSNDPAVCGRGTTSLATGPNGAAETWRTWTICIPFDWDWKNF